MKINKFKKIVIGSLIATTSASALIGVSTGLLLKNYQTSETIKDTNTGNTSNTESKNSSNLGYTFGTNVDSKNAYSAKIVKSGTANPETATYKLVIEGNDKKEGTIYIVGKDGKEETKSLEFKPGDTIQIGIKLNQGFENYTARELKVFGLSENIYVPSKKVQGKKDLFEVKMPNYNDTLDKKTKESWFYKEGTAVKVIPTFIQESIGSNGSTVDWEHGAFHDSLNGYVYEMKTDMTWSKTKDEIYKTFENKDINYPIDIYFYLNGHKLTFDVKEINLNIPSGWALHFYNNKYDKKAENNQYGEIIVPQGQESFLGVKGAVVLGSSVKFRIYHTTDGIRFINYNDKSFVVDDIINDPVVRLGN